MTEKNDYFILENLKTRSVRGTTARKMFCATLSMGLISAIGQVVPLGKGKYGSSFLELAGWLFLALVTSGEDIEEVARELKETVISPYLISNLSRLLRILRT